MNKLDLKLHNYFVAVLENTITGERKEYRAYNIVLDSYYTYLQQSGSNQPVVSTIQVGTGTGTLDPSRTSLFQYLGSSGISYADDKLTCISHSRFQRVMTVTFNETAVVGLLTEVGLGASTYGLDLVTHALFTDSENNPITINKTNTDRLTITATLFCDYTLTGPLSRFGFFDTNSVYSSSKLAYNSEIGKEYIRPSSSAPIPWNFATWITGMAGGLKSGTGTYRGKEISFFTTFYPSNSSVGKAMSTAYVTAEPTSVPNQIRFQANQINSDSGNLGVTYAIKSIGLGQAFYLPFPNHSVYPPKKLTLSAVGDGVTTGFNFGIPELMTANVKVTVDGVVLAANEYEFNGRDYTIQQGLISSDNKYLIESTYERASSMGSLFKTPYYPNGIESKTGVGEFIYDFESSITVDTLISNYTTYLYYSNDGSTWTLAAQVTRGNDNTPIEVSFAEITARYWKWRYETPGGSTASSDGTTYQGFYLKKPQLELLTAPADGALIEVEAYTEYPIKNDKWLIDQMVFDITVERGVST